MLKKAFLFGPWRIPLIARNIQHDSPRLPPWKAKRGQELWAVVPDTVLMQIVSWNVNGIRSCWDSGLSAFLAEERPEIILFQEVKSQQDALPGFIYEPENYQALWHLGGRPGYSGVGAFVRKDLVQPLWHVKGIGVPEIDYEGRVLTLEFEQFFVVTAYFPNSGPGGKRLEFKLNFCRLMKKFCDSLQSRGKGVLLTGDFNIAPSPLDLFSIQASSGEPGVLTEEVSWLNQWLDEGWVDVFRRDRPDQGSHFSWWSYFDDDRCHNRGWRIDLAVADEAFAPALKTELRPDILGSDHCPVVTTWNAHL